jgi:hypothetical protein
MSPQSRKTFWHYNNGELAQPHRLFVVSEVGANVPWPQDMALSRRGGRGLP